MRKQRTNVFANTLTRVLMALFVICLLSCEDNQEFAGMYKGTTVDNLGSEIGEIGSDFDINLAEDGTFTENHTVYSEDGGTLANITINGEWGVKETEFLGSSKMSISGKTIWFKFDLESLHITPDDIANELQTPYTEMFKNENIKLEENEKEGKVYGWNNVSLCGDSLMSGLENVLIAVKVSEN